MKKLTKKAQFEMVMNVVNATEVENKKELMEFIENEIELLEKKSENKKLTKTQVENEEIKEKLIKHLTDAKKSFSISELQTVNEFSTYSNQKLSALLNQLVKSEEVSKSIGNDKKTTFAIVEKVETITIIVEDDIA